MKMFTLLRTSLLSLLFSFSAWAQTSIPAQFSHVDKLVRGTLSMPSFGGPHPAVIIVPGSGANDRDGTLQLVGGYAPCLYPNLVGATLKPYRDLADALVAAGYAVLRYDKLEFTYATNLGVISFDKLWFPARSGIDWLKTRSDIDTNRIVLIGHSEGSALIPLIAAQRPGVKALVSLAGAVSPFDSLLATQLVEFATLCGGNVAQAQTEADQVLAYFNALRAGPPPVTTPGLFGVPAGVWYDYVRDMDSVITRYNQTNKPSLFVALGLDVNTPPSELARFQGGITLPNAGFYLLDSINHFLSYNHTAGFVQPIADTIVHWLQQQGLAASMRPDWETTNTFTFYPNPAKQQIQLLCESCTPSAILALYDIQGRKIQQWQALEPAQTIGLPELQSGIYLLRLNNGPAKRLLIE
ncbi:MAG: T9SS type A sorting domain-containing protein [Bacteroidia bacterium]